MFNHKILIHLLVVGLMLNFVVSIVAQDDEEVKLTQTQVFTLTTWETVFVSYPEGWSSIINSSNRVDIIQFANNTTLLEPESLNNLEEGDILTFMIPTSLNIEYNSDLLIEDDLERLTTIFSRHFQTFPSLEAIEIRGRDVVYFDVEETTRYDRRAYGMLIDNIFIFMDVFTPTGELEQYIPTIEAIFASIDVAFEIGDYLASDSVPFDLELTETASIGDGIGGELNLLYPEGWYSLENDNLNWILLSNVEEYVTVDPNYEFMSDEIGMIIIPASPELAPDLIDDEGEEVSSRAILSNFVEDSFDSYAYNLREVEEINIGSRAVVRIVGTFTTDNDVILDIQLMVWETEAGFVLLFVTTAGQERLLWQDLISEIVQTIEYTR